MLISISTTSGRSWRTCCSASRPFTASATTRISSSKTSSWRKPSRINAWSSTSKMLITAVSLPTLPACIPSFSDSTVAEVGVSVLRTDDSGLTVSTTTTARCISPVCLYCIHGSFSCAQRLRWLENRERLWFNVRDSTVSISNQAIFSITHLGDFVCCALIFLDVLCVNCSRAI